MNTEALQREVRAMARSIARGDRDLADELEQDVLLVALKNSPSDPNAVGSWLWAITRNTFRFARFRAANSPRQSELDSSSELEPTTDDSTPETTAGRAEVSALLAKLISRLPQIYREAIELRVVDGLAPREIAKILGVPTETVRTRVQRGVKRLRSEALAIAEEDDPRWRWGIGLSALRAPLQRAKSGYGVAALVLAAAGTTLGLSPWSQPVDGLGQPRAKLTSGSAQSATQVGELPPSRSRVAVAAAPHTENASVELGLLDGAGHPWPETRLDLRSPGEPQPRQALVRAGSALIEDLEPGEWTAWNGAHALGSLELEPGHQEWNLVALRRTPITVEVAHLDGTPCVGAEIYTRDGLEGIVSLLGVSGPDGSLTALTTLGETWIAARGPVGFRSLAKLVEQPLTEAAGGRIHLDLDPVSPSWFHLELPEGMNASDLTVRERLSSAASQVRSSAGRGIFRDSGWLPAWRDAAGRYGFRKSRDAQIEVVDGAGQVHWVTAPMRDADVLSVKAPKRIVGTLVDAAGDPMANIPVALLPYGKGTSPTARTVTNRAGRFLMDSCTLQEASLVGPTGALTESTDLQGAGSHNFGEVVVNTHAVELKWLRPGRTWEVTALRSGKNRSSTLMAAAPMPQGLTQRVDSTVLAAAVQTIGTAPKSFYLQTADDGDFRSALLTRPRAGWGTAPYLISENMTRPAYLTAEVSPSSLPARGHWIEVESGFQRTALVNQETGEVRSDALPAGTWSLLLVDKSGVVLRSERRTVQPGAHESWGLLEPELGHLRVYLPEAWRNRSSPVKLRVIAAEERAGIHEPFAKRWKNPQAIPSYLDIELAAGRHSVRLRAGDEARSALVDVRPRAMTEATLDEGRSLLHVQVVRHLLTTDPGIELLLLNEAGDSIERWTNLGPRLGGLDRLVFTLPVLDNLTLVVRDGQGQELLRARNQAKEGAAWHINLLREIRRAKIASADAEAHAQANAVQRLDR